MFTHCPDEKMVLFTNGLMKSLPIVSVNVESLSFLKKMQRFHGLPVWPNGFVLRRSIATWRNSRHLAFKVAASCMEKGVKTVTFVALQYALGKLPIHTQIQRGMCGFFEINTRGTRMHAA